MLHHSWVPLAAVIIVALAAGFIVAMVSSRGQKNTDV